MDNYSAEDSYTRVQQACINKSWMQFLAFTNLDICDKNEIWNTTHWLTRTTIIKARTINTLKLYRNQIMF